MTDNTNPFARNGNWLWQVLQSDFSYWPPSEKIKTGKPDRASRSECIVSREWSSGTMNNFWDGELIGKRNARNHAHAAHAHLHHHVGNDSELLHGSDLLSFYYLLVWLAGWYHHTPTLSRGWLRKFRNLFWVWYKGLYLYLYLGIKVVLWQLSRYIAIIRRLIFD